MVPKGKFSIPKPFNVIVPKEYPIVSAYPELPTDPPNIILTPFDVPSLTAVA